MGTYRAARWEARLDEGLRRADRRGGGYLSYSPDLLAHRPLTVSPAVARRAAGAEGAVRRLTAGDELRHLEGLARFLLRGEAIASSQIEGISPSAQQVALAELAQEENIRGFSDQARLVANNITLLRTASRELVDAPEVTVRGVVALHAALLPEERFGGIRSVPNWIGGSNWHPLDADFVPPAPDEVPDLMADLVEYINSAAHAPLIQAALVHAQFESIHPFVDGNGRVGRALIHTVLARRGLSPHAVLPISLVLSTLRDRYVGGLTAFRFDGDSAGPAGAEAVERWLEVFLDAAVLAAEQARMVASDIQELRDGWTEQVIGHRTRVGLRATPRANSATHRILQTLTEAPVMTTATAQRLLGVSFPAARAGLEELADAGVLHRKAVDRGSTGYIAHAVLDLITSAERRLGSTAFDTRASSPNRSVPARPQGG